MISLNLSKAIFRVWGRNNSLMLQHWPCVVDKRHVLIKVLIISRQGCGNVAMNNPHLMSFANLKQRRYNVVIQTSRRRCRFDVVLSTLYRSCHFNICDILWKEFTIQRRGNVCATLRIWRHSIDIRKTLWIWLRDFIVTTMLSLQHS